jgi:hypothetical protein
VIRLYVDMPAVLEAMATADARFFLDTRTGQVEVALDPADGEDECHRLIPHHRKGRSERARLRQALAWLTELGIDPQYDLRPPPPRRRAAGPGEAQIGLVDLLLLGAPDGKTELVDGRVRRVLVTDAERAARVFARVARELAESLGVRWRPTSIEGKTRYEIDRFRLTCTGRRVELEVQVSPAVWEIFAGGA